MFNLMLDKLQKANSKEELDKIIDEKINEEEKFAAKNQVIGIDTDINPRRYIYDGSNTDGYMYDDCYLEWDGYIPLGTKIVYNTWYSNDERFLSFNGGGYYYVDDLSYLKEFMYAIKDEEVPDIQTLINYIHSYLCYKLENSISKKDRMEIHKVISKDEDSFFEPLKEHSIKDFYQNGSGLCTEYSVMGQNILSFFDVNSRLLLTGDHAFQMIEIEGVYHVLDFSKTAGVLDHNLKLVNKLPYFNRVGILSEDWFDKFTEGDAEIRLKEYFVLCIRDRFYKMETQTDRVYKVIVDSERKDLSNGGDVKTYKRV